MKSREFGPNIFERLAQGSQSRQRAIEQAKPVSYVVEESDIVFSPTRNRSLYRCRFAVNGALDPFILLSVLYGAGSVKAGGPQDGTATPVPTRTSTPIATAAPVSKDVLVPPINIYNNITNPSYPPGTFLVTREELDKKVKEGIESAVGDLDKAQAETKVAIESARKAEADAKVAIDAAKQQEADARAAIAAAKTPGTPATAGYPWEDLALAAVGGAAIGAAGTTLIANRRGIRVWFRRLRRRPVAPVAPVAPVTPGPTRTTTTITAPDGTVSTTVTEY